MTAKTIIEEIKRGLAAHLPFSAMAAEDLDYLVAHVTVAYFAPGQQLMAAGTVPTECVIVRQGRVDASDPETNAVVLNVGAGDCLPLGALLASRAVELDYHSAADTFCYLLPREHFDTLTQRSEIFLDFCRRKLGAMIDRSREQLQRAYAGEASVHRTMGTALSELIQSPAVTCNPDTPLRVALERMDAAHVGSILVVDQSDPRAPVVGILTRTDLIGRVILPGIALDAPISTVMTRDVRTLDTQATAADATLLMAEHGIRHVPVVERSERESKVIGVVSERDLFALQRLTVRQITTSIERADDASELAAVARDLRRLSHNLVAQGVSAAQMTRLISHLNDQLTSRILTLACARFGIDSTQFCWLAFGSEGRSEQTIATDQDNGIIACDSDLPQARLLELADWTNRMLDTCGYPLCKGNIMARNPAWCRTLPEWSAQFAGWIDRGDPESLLAASIFFDLRPLFGLMDAGDRLRSEVVAHAARNLRFLKQMADNALRNRVSVPARIVDAFFENGSGRVDLKMQGTVPFVEGARIWALAAGLEESGTAARMSRVAAAGRLPTDDVRAWIAAFEFFQLMRLRIQHRSDHSHATANPNEVEIADLSALDRRIVNESFRQARKLQQRLELDFPG